MSGDYSTEAAAVADAMNAVYENKQTNKKTDISGDFSTDTASYPTVQATKNPFGNKVTSWSSTTTDTNYPSEKLVKGSLDNKSNNDHTHGNLTNDGKVGTNANYFVTTTTSGAVTSKQKIGNINTDGKIGSTANLPLITTTAGTVTTGSFGTSANTFCQGNDSRLSDARTPTSHDQATTTITNNVAYDNIKTGESSTLTLTNQKLVNDAINDKLAAIGAVELVTVVAELPTASASTMNKLYLVAEATAATHDNYEVYITVRTGTSPDYGYNWEKVDTTRIDLSGYSTTSHGHGNIDKDGKIGTTSGLPVKTGSGGALTTGAFGTTAGTFAEGNHTHSSYTSVSDVQSEISAFASALAEAINPSS